MKRLLQIISKLHWIPWTIAGLMLFVGMAHAQSYLGAGWDQFLQQLPNFQGASERTGVDLVMALVRNAVRIVRTVIGVVAVLYGIIYGMMLVLARGKDDVITKYKDAFVYLVLGFAILLVADPIAALFAAPTATAENLINYSAARTQLFAIKDYTKWMLGAVTVGFMALSGIKLIFAQGEEDAITTEKRHITWGGIGLLVILLADGIINAFYAISDSTGDAVPAGPQAAITQIAEVIRFIMIFLGPAAVGFTIYAGWLYLAAMDNDEQAQEARNMIVGGVTAIVIIYSAYAIANTVITGGVALS